jgi:fibronectin-binding autotransporter adhesin
MKSRPFFFGRLLLLPAAFISLSGSAPAATFFWDHNGAAAGTGGTGAWDTTSSFWRTGSDVGALGTYGNANNDAVVLAGTAGMRRRRSE